MKPACVQRIFADVPAFHSITLSELTGCADLQSRTDRKYVVRIPAVRSVLAGLPDDTRSLEIEGSRWFRYKSVYFDTAAFDSYRLAAIRRPQRFKVRTRSYLDAGGCNLEVKIKDRRGRTVKHRVEHRGAPDLLNPMARSYLERYPQTEAYADGLEPTLTTRYDRATLLLSGAGARATIDRGLRCTLFDGRATELVGACIIESKSAGPPTSLDRALWRAGHRPVRISKFATGLAAIRRDLPANRWHRVLERYFPDPAWCGGATL